MTNWNQYAREQTCTTRSRLAVHRATVGSIVQLTTKLGADHGGTIGKLAVEHRPIPPRANNDNYPRVIALSGVAGSGKSTASAFLQSKGYRLEKFAASLKEMLRAVGFGDSELEGELKEVPQVLLGGHTPRYMMQTLGTEWGRKCMGEDFWVNIWRINTESNLQFGIPVVVDDCRFANEAAAVRALGGIVIKLEGRGGIEGGHSSENLDFIADAVVPNTGSIAQLHALIDETLIEWAA